VEEIFGQLEGLDGPVEEIFGPVAGLRAPMFQ
jgi:hypothetical protein